MTSQNTTGSQVAARAGTTVTVPVPSAVTNAFPALDPDQREELEELFAENMAEGETLSIRNLTILTVPSGKSAAMWSWTENSEEKSAKTVSGIVCGWVNGRNYWESDEVTGEAPDCTSRDGVYGIGLYGQGSPGNPAGTCGTCPMGQWSDGPIGTDGKAKRIPAPCKPQQRLLLLREGDIFPTIVQVPRTSMANFKAYKAELLHARPMRGLSRVVTEIGLNKIIGKDRGVPDYFEITFKCIQAFAEDGAREERTAIGQAAIAFGESFKPTLTNTPVVVTSAETENVVPGEGGVSIDDAPDYSQEGAPA